MIWFNLDNRLYYTLFSGEVTWYKSFESAGSAYLLFYRPK